MSGDDIEEVLVVIGVVDVLVESNVLRFCNVYLQVCLSVRRSDDMSLEWSSRQGSIYTHRCPEATVPPLLASRMHDTAKEAAHPSTYHPSSTTGQTGNASHEPCIFGNLEKYGGVAGVWKTLTVE